MLGKLIRHEWKNTYKFGCLMLALMAGFTLLGALAFQMPMWREMSAQLNQLDNGSNIARILLNILSITLLVIYGFVLVGISIGTIIYLGVHFYKTMFTDQGYLTHTLPVMPGQILFSKVLVGGIWQLIVALTTGISITILVVSAMISMFSSLPELEQVMGEVYRELPTLTHEIEQLLGINFSVYGLVAVLTGILYPFFQMIIVYAAFAIGQLFTKVKVVMSILSYAAIMMVLNLIQSTGRTLLSLVSVYDMDTVGSMSWLFGFSIYFNLIIYVAVGAGLYWLTYYIMTHKLNLD